MDRECVRKTCIRYEYSLLGQYCRAGPDGRGMESWLVWPCALECLLCPLQDCGAWDALAEQAGDLTLMVQVQVQVSWQADQLSFQPMPRFRAFELVLQHLPHL